MRADEHGEGGFSLIELVASLTILAVGIGAVMQTFSTSFSVAGVGNNRSRAVALATREAESMRSIPYEQVGFSTTQAGYAPTFEGATTVLVSDPGMSPTGPDQTVGGLVFHFTRHVVWADAASASGYPEAYKRIVVIVRWTDQMPHEVRQDAFVYPGGLGAYAGPQGATTAVTSVVSETALPPAAPLSLTASVPASSDGATTVNLSWTPSAVIVPAVANWVIQYSTNGFLTANVLTDTQPAGTTTFSATGLSPATLYSFRVAAKSSAGAQSTWSLVATATTSAVVSGACQLGTSTITPSAVLRLHGGTTMLTSDAVVSVNAAGTCSSLMLKFSATAGSESTMYMTPIGGVWTATISGLATPWDTGIHDIKVVNATGTVLGTLTFTVCVHNAKTCP